MDKRRSFKLLDGVMNQIQAHRVECGMPSDPPRSFLSLQFNTLPYCVGWVSGRLSHGRYLRTVSYLLDMGIHQREKKWSSLFFKLAPSALSDNERDMRIAARRSVHTPCLCLFCIDSRIEYDAHMSRWKTTYYVKLRISVHSPCPGGRLSRKSPSPVDMFGFSFRLLWCSAISVS